MKKADKNYHRRLFRSVKKAEEIGINPPPVIDFKKKLSRTEKFSLEEHCQQAFSSRIQETFEGYFGNKCIDIASGLFNFLKQSGVRCELVIGDVMIHKTFEYDTTLEGLCKEYSQGLGQGVIVLHVWVNVGKNFILDPSIVSRLHRYYPSFPDVQSMSEYQLIAGTPASLEVHGLEYYPMLSGAEFIAKTCGKELNL